jgi:hypothetical protein
MENAQRRGAWIVDFIDDAGKRDRKQFDSKPAAELFSSKSRARSRRTATAPTPPRLRSRKRLARMRSAQPASGKADQARPLLAAGFPLRNREPLLEARGAVGERGGKACLWTARREPFTVFEMRHTRRARPASPSGSRQTSVGARIGAATCSALRIFSFAAARCACRRMVGALKWNQTGFPSATRSMAGRGTPSCLANRPGAHQ